MQNKTKHAITKCVLHIILLTVTIVFLIIMFLKLKTSHATELKNTLEPAEIHKMIVFSVGDQNII